MFLGALEAGGTKMVCSVGNENWEVLEREVFPTLSPAETLPRMIEYFREKRISALGIGCFGPLELNPASPRYGTITTTPKPGWQYAPILPEMAKALNVPGKIDTDVNAAALSEVRVGAAKGLNSCLYVTVGTGVGGGLIAEGKLVHGLVHPEFGHMLLRPLPEDPSPDGFCPYHKGCLEGLACGASIEKRWGQSAKTLGDDHPAWRLETEYLAQMCANAIMCFSPQKIVLGGGVMHRAGLFAPIRSRALELLGGYIQSETLLLHMDDYIVPPALGDLSGVTGALMLAAQALKG